MIKSGAVSTSAPSNTWRSVQTSLVRWNFVQRARMKRRIPSKRRGNDRARLMVRAHRKVETVQAESFPTKSGFDAIRIGTTFFTFIAGGQDRQKGNLHTYLRTMYGGCSSTNQDVINKETLTRKILRFKSISWFSGMRRTRPGRVLPLGRCAPQIRVNILLIHGRMLLPQKHSSSTFAQSGSPIRRFHNRTAMRLAVRH